MAQRENTYEDRPCSIALPYLQHLKISRGKIAKARSREPMFGEDVGLGRVGSQGIPSRSKSIGRIGSWVEFCPGRVGRRHFDRTIVGRAFGHEHGGCDVHPAPRLRALPEALGRKGKDFGCFDFAKSPLNEAETARLYKERR
jgi:hypothetical protein